MDQFQSTIRDLYALLASMSVRDAIDVVMVALFFYLLLSLIRESRSQVALRGLMLVLGATFVLYMVTLVSQLRAMRWLFEQMGIVLIMMYLIVFQAEFKKALIEYGRLPIFRAFFKQESAALDEIVRAAARLAEKRVGALICLERRTALRPYIETGTSIDSQVNVEILRTIFAPYTPLHDGAVIVRNNRIAAAACLLPLTGQDLSKDIGTRHRAAVGLTEETDAVVVIVSEETGIISLAHDGMLERPETPETLRQKLRDPFEIEEEEDGSRQAP